MPGVHAVLTHVDVQEKIYGPEFRDQPVLAIDWCGTSASRLRCCRSSGARRGLPRRSASSTSRSSPSPTWSARRTAPTCIRSGRPLGTSRPRRPAAERRPHDRHHARQPRGRRRDRRRGRLRNRHPGPGVPRPGVRSCGARRGRRHRHSRRNPVAPRRPRADRPCCPPSLPSVFASISLGSGARSEGARTSSMQIHAALLALHTNRAVKIRLQPRGVVHGPRTAILEDVGEAHRRTRREARQRRDADPARWGARYASSSTAVAANAAALCLRALRSSPTRARGHGRLHQQNPPCGAMRGFGAVQTCFAGEAQMACARRRTGDRPDRAALLLNALEPR